MDLSKFNASDVPESLERTPVPAGHYLAVISDTESRLTRKAQESGNKNDGFYLSITFDIIEGPCRGRKVFHNVNLLNQNEKAVQIGRHELASIYRALGLENVKTDEELRDKPLMIETFVEVSDGFPDTARVKKFSAAQGAPVQATAKPTSWDTSDGDDTPF
jgi:hypothetical protein